MVDKQDMVDSMKKKDGEKYLRTKIDEALHRRFRAAAVMKGLSLHEATAEAVTLWIELQHDKAD